MPGHPDNSARATDCGGPRGKRRKGSATLHKQSGFRRRARGVGLSGGAARRGRGGQLISQPAVAAGAHRFLVIAFQKGGPAKCRWRGLRSWVGGVHSVGAGAPRLHPYMYTCLHLRLANRIVGRFAGRTSGVQLNELYSHHSSPATWLAPAHLGIAGGHEPMADDANP